MLQRLILTALALCLGTLWLTACGPGEGVPPSPPTESATPSLTTPEPSPVPDVAEPTATPEEAPVRGPVPSQPPVEDGMLQGMAYVDRVTVLVDGAEAVTLQVTGNLADGCTELAGNKQSVVSGQL